MGHTCALTGRHQYLLTTSVTVSFTALTGMMRAPGLDVQVSPSCTPHRHCDESVSRGRETGTKGRETGTKGRRTGTIGTKERGNEKPYGLVQIEYWDRGTSPRHVWTWQGRVTPFLDV